MCLQHDVHDRPTEIFAENLVTEKRQPLSDFAEVDVTTIDAKALGDAGSAVGATAPSSLHPGSPGAISSNEITAQAARAIDSLPPPTAQPPSDPTTATLRASEFVHLVAGTLVGEYVVEKLLGSGGMGAVYGGRHERLGKRVAIKVISPNLSVDAGAVERFEQEALALARISHPNVVDVLNVGRLPGDDRSYLVMQWLVGEALQARLDRGPVPLHEALDVLDQVARGLEAAHAAGIIHRDLKPDNVWLERVGDEPRPIVKILDFGLAKLAEHRRTEHTAMNVMFGTAAYMSPEQCQSSRDVGRETDVYAFGCIAYEVLCGRLPFDYDNVAALVAAHQVDEPPRPRDLAPQLDGRLDCALFAMLAKDPARRPTLAVVRTMIAVVREAAASRTTAHMSSAPGRIGASWRRRAFVVAGLILIGGIVAAALEARPWNEPGARPKDAAGLDGGQSREPPIVKTPAPVAPLVLIDAPAVAARPTRDAALPESANAADPTTVEDASVPLAVDADPSPTPIRPTQPAKGFVKITPPQGAQVLVDGVPPVGSLGKLPLAPGRHKVQFIVGSDKDAFLVMIEAGETVILDKRDLHRRPTSIDRDETFNPFRPKP